MMPLELVAGVPAVPVALQECGNERQLQELNSLFLYQNK